MPSHYIHVSKTDLLTLLSFIMLQHVKIKSVNFTDSVYIQQRKLMSSFTAII
jgi:hypothetical protein